MSYSCDWLELMRLSEVWKVSLSHLFGPKTITQLKSMAWHWWKWQPKVPSSAVRLRLRSEQMRNNSCTSVSPSKWDCYWPGNLLLDDLPEYRAKLFAILLRRVNPVIFLVWYCYRRCWGVAYSLTSSLQVLTRRGRSRRWNFNHWIEMIILSLFIYTKAQYTGCQV